MKLLKSSITNNKSLFFENKILQMDHIIHLRIMLKKYYYFSYFYLDFEAYLHVTNINPISDLSPSLTPFAQLPSSYFLFSPFFLFFPFFSFSPCSFSLFFSFVLLSYPPLLTIFFIFIILFLIISVLGAPLLTRPASKKR